MLLKLRHWHISCNHAKRFPDVLPLYQQRWVTTIVKGLAMGRASAIGRVVKLDFLEGAKGNVVGGDSNDQRRGRV